jgi:hypothetical protein
MNARERIRAALSHREPDRLPVDFGATPVSGMHVSVVAALRRHYGLGDGPVKVHEPYQMLGVIDDDLADRLGLDCVGVPGAETMFGVPNDDWKEWTTPWGQTVLISARLEFDTADRGEVLVYPRGDRSAAPCARMPAAGYFFDTIIRQPDLEEDDLNVEDNLEEFGPLSEDALDYFDRATAAAAASGRAVVCGMPGTALGDIALVPAPFLPHPKGIRDIEEWYVSILTRPDYVRELFDRQTAVALENMARLAERVGDRIDVANLCGTDFGTQTSQFCSREVFDDLYLPFYRRMTDWIHDHTPWKVFKHSCGAVAPLIPNFIEAGFDILNPVQCSATGMDPRFLKETYGDRIVFWGGGIDTQHVLPFGTPGQVRAETLERCKAFSPGGGFVFNAIHNVQAKTPVENLVAMFDALREFRGL